MTRGGRLFAAIPFEVHDIEKPAGTLGNSMVLSTVFPEAVIAGSMLEFKPAPDGGTEVPSSVKSGVEFCCGQLRRQRFPGLFSIVHSREASQHGILPLPELGLECLGQFRLPLC